jgi:2-polyprenyl-3-methyl-5-hydroxy-6-metoxy-1,4-benzoquinol methylase
MSEELERLRRSWIANATAWCDAVRNQSIESRRLVTDEAVITAILQLNPGRVLDLGCGEGWLARALVARGIEVTGIDASLPLVEAARALGGATFLVMTYEDVVADPSRLRPAFDAIVMNFSILDDRGEEILRALLPSLSEDGRLVVQTVHPLFARADGIYADGWCVENFAALPGEWPESMPWYFRTVGSWIGMFARAGYEVAEVREPLYPDRPGPASMLFICRRPSHG